MYSTIDKFAGSGLITRDEAESASDAEATGTDSHTIGYEVEVLASARKDIARAAKIASDEALYWKCYDKLGPYGYEVGFDGLYELQSPASGHPHALAVATQGLANYGWLPKKGTRGLVTSHVSIGTTEDLNNARFDNTLSELVMVLRGVEMYGGTTPTRLNAPLRKALEYNHAKATFSWNQKGDYGVKLVPIDILDKKKISWEGENSRIEFRTLGYYNPKQFGAMLNAVYYLTRGLFASDEGATDIYADYYHWMLNYFDANQLPHVNSVLSSTRTRVLDEYLSPYVEHLADADLSEVRNKTAQTVRDLREEFRMTHIPLNDDHLVGADSGLPFRG